MVIFIVSFLSLWLSLLFFSLPYLLSDIFALIIKWQYGGNGSQKYTVRYHGGLRFTSTSWSTRTFLMYAPLFISSKINILIFLQ
jgi:hypothetical protein